MRLLYWHSYIEITLFGSRRNLHWAMRHEADMANPEVASQLTSFKVAVGAKSQGRLSAVGIFQIACKSGEQSRW